MERFQADCITVLNEIVCAEICLFCYLDSHWAIVYWSKTWQGSCMTMIPDVWLCSGVHLLTVHMFMVMHRLEMSIYQCSSYLLLLNVLLIVAIRQVNTHIVIENILAPLLLHKWAILPSTSICWLSALTLESKIQGLTRIGTVSVSTFFQMYSPPGPFF